MVAVLKARGLATTKNLAAIEKMIAANQKLGFSDDDVRQSIQTATQFTKKFSEAQKISAVAAEVAAAKGISLAEATSLVGRGFMGNLRGLKMMGVELPKGAKGMSVLEAVSKKYTGVAEKMSKTTAVQMKILGIVIDELKESIGYALLPILNNALVVFRDKILPVIVTVAEKVRDWITSNKALIDSIGKLIGDKIAGLIGGLQRVADIVQKYLIPIWDLFQKQISAILLPVMEILNEVLAETLKVVFEVAQILIKYLTPIIKEAVARFGEWVKGIEKFLKALMPATKELKAGFFEAVKNVVNVISKMLAPTIKALADFFGILFDAISQIVREVGPVLVDMFKRIMPAITEVGNVIFQVIVPAVLKLAGAVIKNLLPPFIKLVKFFAKEVVPRLADIAAFIARTLAPVFTTIANVVGEKVLPVIGRLVSFFIDNVLPIVMQVADVIGSILGPAFQVVAGIINGLIEVVGWLFDRLNDIINVAGEVGKAIADSPLGWLAARVGDVVGGVAGTVGNAAGAIGGAMAPQPAVAAGYVPAGYAGGVPVTNVNVTLDGKEIAKNVDKRLGYGAD
jgi:phage-related protein